MALKLKLKLPKIKLPKLKLPGLKLPKVALPKISLPKWSALLGWRLALAVFSLWGVVMLGLLWHSGSSETMDAFLQGRRMLIRMDNGKIEGRQNEPEPKPVAATTPVEEAKEMPAETAPASSPAPAPEANADTALSLPPDVSVVPEEKAAPIPPAAVALAPVKDALLQKADAGMLPVIGSDGTKPWRYYAKPYEHKGSLPMIAIIVTGLGENKMVAENAARLPENVTLSFSPYAHDVATWVNTARVAGHEVMVDLPLEPSNYPATDPGPDGLMAADDVSKNESRMQWLMSRFSGYSGFVTPQNEAFSGNGDAFKWLLQMLANHGLLLVMGHEPAKSEVRQGLEASTTPNVTADLLVDEDLSATAIQARLSSLEQIARSRGYAVGIAQPFPLTIEQLRAWAAKLGNDGFVLVPVTFIAKLRFS
ncbi:MAG: divergent polysaccharide deacetylase family protein [Pseudomonadota bacterium]|nr:divergent polysaccharide deacetylase family protein [Pseudomonadota bacterium]